MRMTSLLSFAVVKTGESWFLAHFESSFHFWPQPLFTDPTRSYQSFLCRTRSTITSKIPLSMHIRNNMTTDSNLPIRFAVIGTNWITERFIQAAHATSKFHLSAVYSRDLSKAADFASRNQAPSTPATPSPVCFDDLSTLARADLIDAVYIASPNSLHASQARLLLSHRKHVLVEKPLASNRAEVVALQDLARHQGVILMEAMKTLHVLNMDALRKGIEMIAPVHKAHLSYCQRSSRYPKYLAGENPNTFNKDFSNGSLMDLGVYAVSLAVDLFGPPTQVHATAQLLDQGTGVDGHGFLLLTHPSNVHVMVSHSKISDSSPYSNEIQGEMGTLLIEDMSNLANIALITKNPAAQNESTKTLISKDQHQNSMIYEAHVFADLIRHAQNPNNMDRDAQKRYEYYSNVTLAVSDVLTQARVQVGLKYPADTENDIC